jgi:hypothetical protein
VGVQQLGVKKKNTSWKKEHQILIICYSHVGGCTSNVKHNLDAFEIQGFVKPGAGEETITNIAKKHNEKLSKKMH